MFRQLTDLTFKCRKLIKMIPTLLAVREISPIISTSMFYPPAEVHSASGKDIFGRIVNGFKLTLLTLFTKSSIVDV